MREHWTKFVRGRTTPRGEMNKTEAEYFRHLEGRKLLGEVIWYGFEAITFKLGKDCRYTPDFVVQLSDGMLEAHEVKGFWADDAKVKIRLAAEKFPFAFKAFKKQAKKHGGGFSCEEF